MQDKNTQILELIRKHYPNLAERQLLDEIASVGKIVSLSAGESIMEIGSYIKMVPLLVEGTISVSREDDDGHEILLYYLNPGSACSMSFTCCMMNKRSEIRAIAEERSIMIGIPIRYMDEWMNKYQSWKNFIMRSYDNRLMEMVYTIDSIAFKKMDARLVEYLEKKAEALGSNIINATHQNIAADLNASREAVSRLLKSLEKDGMVKLHRNKVEILE